MQAVASRTAVTPVGFFTPNELPHKVFEVRGLTKEILVMNGRGQGEVFESPVTIYTGAAPGNDPRHLGIVVIAPQRKVIFHNCPRHHRDMLAAWRAMQLVARMSQITAAKVCQASLAMRGANGRILEEARKAVGDETFAAIATMIPPDFDRVIEALEKQGIAPYFSETGSTQWPAHWPARNH